MLVYSRNFKVLLQLFLLASVVFTIVIHFSIEPRPVSSHVALNHWNKAEQNNELHIINENYAKTLISVEEAPYYYDYHVMLKTASLNEPGQAGKPVVLTGKEELQAGRESYKRTAINLVASEKIPVWRTVKENRHPLCKSQVYKDLPTASAIIIFHNEERSVLLRTMHSIINRSPPSLLKELIIVDDASNPAKRPFLGEPLADYIAKTWPVPIDFVRLIRLPHRQGLIRTRSRGIKEAKGDVVILFDSHCEVSEGWLEPLLARIKEKRTAVVSPDIQSIFPDTLEYGTPIDPYAGLTWVGGFLWDMNFEWSLSSHRLDHSIKSPIEPVRSPTMVGCIFAVRRDYFYEMGGYDEGMDIWGGENIELPFRVWMCGGSVEIMPCSKAGHIWRRFHSYTFPGNKDYHGLNSKRFAEVWMDEYKHMYYQVRPDVKSYPVADNINVRHALRKRLNCTSFKWYLDNVATYKFIPRHHAILWGQIYSNHTKKCLFRRNDVITQTECNSDNLKQMFAWDKRTNWLRSEKRCFSSNSHGVVKFEICSNNNNMPWNYDGINGELRNKLTGKCLESKVDSENTLSTQPCAKNITRQRWTIVSIPSILTLGTT